MKIKNIKVPQKIVQPFSADDLQKLLGQCDAGTRKGARNQALILVLLDTGLRASELANLELADVDFATQRMLIKHAKGNKQRVVRFGERTRQALLHYIGSFRGDAPGYLLLTARGRRHLNRSAMRTIFRSWVKNAGSQRCTLTASVTPAPPGPSNSRPGRSMSSASSGTQRRRCCAATRPPTMRRGRLRPTLRSDPATASQRSRQRDLSSPRTPDFPEVSLKFPYQAPYQLSCFGAGSLFTPLLPRFHPGYRT